MRVLQVHTRYRQRGGEDAVVDGERELLTRAGHEVRLFEAQNPDGTASSLARLTAAPWNPLAAKRVVNEARIFGAEVVHVHNTWFSLSPAVFDHLHRAGFPVVATLHNYRVACLNGQFYRQGRPCEDCLGRLPWPGVVHGCYRGSRTLSGVAALTIGSTRVAGSWERKVDTVVALTPFAEGKLTAAGVPADRIVVMPNTAADPGERSGPPSRSDEVLYVGRLSPEKGVSDLVEAWPGSSALRLTVVGGGPLEPDLRAKPRRGVRLVGNLSPESVKRRMLTARAVVMPSRWYEGLPMVLLEAMAAGLGAVVPEIGALPEAVGEGGLTFRPGELGRVLSRLESDQMVDDLGAGARRRFLRDYSAQAGLSRLLSVYRRAMAVE